MTKPIPKPDQMLGIDIGGNIALATARQIARKIPHAGANLKFVQYQPHANARDRKLNPALYFIRLFMNLLLAGTLTFFMIHTILWLVRARVDQLKNKSANGGDHA